MEAGTSNTYPPFATLPGHDKRLAAARAAAGWYLGDRSWADQIIGYYTNPEDSMVVLRQQMED